MIDFITYSIFFSASLYIVNLLAVIIGLFKYRDKNNNREILSDISVSVIIAARNEENSIATTIEKIVNQNYNSDLYEIIVIDDNSVDHTPEILLGLIEKYKISVITLPKNTSYKSRKKYALEQGINASTGEILLFTDADCDVKPNWISTMLKPYSDNSVGIVSGPVVCKEKSETGLFMKMQSLEYICQTFLGAGYIGLKKPVLANGNNLSYRRTLYNKVNGFSGLENIESGDDDLMVQKITKECNTKVVFCDSLDAVNSTDPVTHPLDFLNQRARWASKGLKYSSIFLNGLLLTLYLFFLYILVAPVLLCFFPKTIPVLIYALGVKVLVDVVFAVIILKRINRLNLLPYLFFAEVFQAPYLVYAGFAGTFGLYKWKRPK